MQLLKHFKEISLHPKNAKELKGLILQLAVQGKLTSQWRKENPNVEPAKKLLERIKSEKEKLIKEKTIKKEKPLPPITDVEVPYELTESWFWCRLGEVFQVGSSKRIYESDYVSLGIPFFRSREVGELSKGKEATSRLFISQNKYEELSRKFGLPKSGDLLITSVGSIGNSWIVDNRKFYFKDGNITQLKGNNFVDVHYLQYFIKSPVFKSEVLDKVSGTAYNALTIIKLKNIKFPLPPLAEQKAIIKIVEQLFKEVEHLETLTEERIQLKEKFATSALKQLTINNTVKEWEYLKPHFHTFFNEEPNIKKLRETILQLAVQGKLTAHWRTSNPIVEPAEQLLERIKEKKERLIEEKKIKKEKPLLPITKEEIPYELPEGWVWCRLGEITRLITDGKHGNCQDEANSGYYFLSAKDVQNGSLLYDNARQINYKEFQEVHNRTNLEPNDLCIVNTGATVGKTAIALNIEFTTKTTFQKSVAVVKVLHDFFNIHYLEYFIKSQTPKLLKKSGGSAINNLLLGDMKKIITPLPPFKEQKAIVEKVNSLMALCDSLEQEVKQSKVEIEKLMKGVLREVVLIKN